MNNHHYIIAKGSFYTCYWKYCKGIHKITHSTCDLTFTDILFLILIKFNVECPFLVSSGLLEYLNKGRSTISHGEPYWIINYVMIFPRTNYLRCVHYVPLILLIKYIKKHHKKWNRFIIKINF